MKIPILFFKRNIPNRFPIFPLVKWGSTWIFVVTIKSFEFCVVTKQPKVVGKLLTTKSGIHEASSHQVHIFNGEKKK